MPTFIWYLSGVPICHTLSYTSVPTGDLRCHLGPKNATQKPMVVWGRYMLGQSKKPV